VSIKSRLVLCVTVLYALIPAMILAVWLATSGSHSGPFPGWLWPFLAACAVLGLVLALAVAHILSNMLFSPLESLRIFASRLAKEEQPGLPGGAFAQETEGLHVALVQLAGSLAEMRDAAQSEQQRATQEARAARADLETAQSREHDANQRLERMTAAAGKAQNVSEKVFAGIGDLSSQVDAVNKGVEVQRDRMTETATAMEEMNATVLEVARNASQAAIQAEKSKHNAVTGAQGVAQAVDSIQQIQRRVFSLKETMGKLGQRADSIGQIMGVISDIADQTNLLALNAAIEAARAGEAGRGFSVVADEVRKLAEKTMKATEEVRAAIQEIQNHARENVDAVEATAADIVKSTEAATESGRFMQEIVDIVEETAGMVASIATAAEEQSATSEEINRAVSEVTQIAADTSEGMERSASALVEIASQVEELDTVIQAISGSSNVSIVSTGDQKSLIQWSDDLSVHIPSIDGQHQKLVALINELHAAMKSGKSNAHLLEIFDRLKEYTVNHFGHEEKLFARHGYPEAEEHMAAHRQFVGKVLEWEKALKSGKGTVSMEIMRFLKKWLTGHIMGVDQRYGQFLLDKGVR